MKPAVKTDARAMDALYSIVMHFDKCEIKKISGRCECGETIAIAVYVNGGIVAKVNVCDACGDDNYTDNEVTHIY